MVGVRGSPLPWGIDEDKVSKRKGGSMEDVLCNKVFTVTMSTAKSAALWLKI